MSSAKFINSLSDEHNKDLQKQIGCMNAIFQIFDRHHFLSSRRIVAQNQKGIPSGRIHNQKTEHPDNKSQKSTEKNQKPVKEKQRNSTESSRSSFSSSSCSSSFSSADCSKLSHLDSAKSSFSHISIPETPCLIYNPKTASLHSSQQSIDLRDFVKDFIQRDARTISIKHKGEESGGGTLKYMDSPRPSHNITREAPRFSYDGRESRDKLKSNAAKLRELPRLSLDSRERSMKQCRLLGSSVILDQERELASHKRSSSVVAKLMGLEALPDSEQIEMNRTQLSGVSASPRNSYREPESRIPDSITRLKFPIEPAPWRQADHGSKSPQKPISKCQGSKSSLSVYGEIEKRLADLEFKKSGKDQRALKQILVAMQRTKELLETRKEEQALNISLNPSLNKSAYLQSVSSVSQTTKAACLKSPIVIIKTAKHLEKVNPAVKPSMHRLRIGSQADNRKETVNQQRTRDLSPRTNHRTSPPSVKVNSVRASGTLSPRLQQQIKQEFENENEKRSRATTPSSESSRMRKPPNSRQPINSGSPHRSPRPKSQTLQDELQHGSKEQSPKARFINEKLVAGPAKGVVEQPSPISVLEAPFNGDESPSPVKKISNAFKGDVLVYDETEWTPQDINYSPINYSPICSKPNLRAATDHKNVEKSTPDFLQLLDAYEATNPHHRYILEILIASGLIRDLESTNSTIKAHSTGCLIDPKLFLTLEQRNVNTNIAGYRQTIQKALVFDVANEILYRKLVLEATPAHYFSSSGTLAAGKRPKGKQLLEDLCSEIDHLETNCSSTYDEDEIFKNMLEKSTDWRSDLVSETSGVVLDIERLIFKDLISEVLTSVVADKQRGQHCRQLFSK